MERSVTLRSERYGDSAYYLRAYLRTDGMLVIEGHDLGETTRRFWGSGEYEWTIAIAKEQLPALVDTLGGQAGADALELLSTRYRED
ncbi:MAG TPA: hypothetical protein VMP67_05840, partial [Candidatus Limnocylindria bacterium]|nr:hypothetical protein [Candidatus Limnocylindria bacterium]